MSQIRSICVFCGSSIGRSAAYSEAAHDFGREIAHAGIQLVYGGGSLGLMGLLADSVIKHGGEVVGVIPQSIDDREVSHQGIQELHIVGSMHERKAMMSQLSDAFVALPGGLGTFEELLEIMTWAQLGIHNKPILVANIASYYDPLLALINHGIQQGFIGTSDESILLNTDDVGQIIPMLQEIPTREYRTKWLRDDQI